ncbi:MAG: C_GCAxxG_C_C family protein [Desulfobacteraceae bacterium]|nr:MAG: C_GCAxxG_C_C family protein [Desulfobacteraceae bacterium]
MKKQDIEKITFDYFSSGFNCAESVSKTIIEAFADRPVPDLPKMASAFGGGVGGTREELCGALAGGILAVGYLTGRMQPGADLSQTKKLASDLREQFMAQYGATQCRAVLEKLGPQKNSLKCKELAAKVAGMLAELLANPK